MRFRNQDHDAPGRAAARTRRGVTAIPLLVALALGLALAGCDRCGDFYWQGQIDACHTHPAQN